MGGARWSGRPVVVVGERDHVAARATGIDVMTVRELERFDPEHDAVPEAVVVHGDDTTVRLALTAVAATSVAFGVAACAAAGPLGSFLSGSLVGTSARSSSVGESDGDAEPDDDVDADAGRDRAGPREVEPDDAAVARVLGAPLRRLDLGRIDDERFLTSATFGVGRLVPDEAEDHDVATPVRVLRRAVQRWRRRGRITVHVDGVQRWRGRTPVVVVANSPQVIVGNRASTVVGLDADPADGELDVAVLAPRRPDRWMMMWWREVLGVAHDARDLRVHRGHWVHLHAEDVLPLEVDGGRFRPTTAVDLHADPASLVLLDTMVAPPAVPLDEPDHARDEHEHEPDDRERDEYERDERNDVPPEGAR